MTIRPATSNDAAAIARVHVETWQSAYRGIIADEVLDGLSLEDRAARWSDILRREEQATFVAVPEQNGIVGFINGGPERDGREDYDAELYALYVHPGSHGEGVGKRLTATFTQWLIDSGYDSMFVWVLADNPARKFYEKLGGTILDEKTVEIGGRTLLEVAYGWNDLWRLTVNREP